MISAQILWSLWPSVTRLESTRGVVPHWLSLQPQLVSLQFLLKKNNQNWFNEMAYSLQVEVNLQWLVALLILFLSALIRSPPPINHISPTICHTFLKSIWEIFVGADALRGDLWPHWSRPVVTLTWDLYYNTIPCPDLGAAPTPSSSRLCDASIIEGKAKLNFDTCINLLLGPTFQYSSLVK